MLGDPPIPCVVRTCKALDVAKIGVARFFISYDLYRDKIQPKRKKNIVEAFMKCPVDVDLGALIEPRGKGNGRAKSIT